MFKAFKHTKQQKLVLSSLIDVAYHHNHKRRSLLGPLQDKIVQILFNPLIIIYLITPRVIIFL